MKRFINDSILILIFSFCSVSFGQGIEALKSQFNSDRLKIGGLFQFVFDHQNTRMASGENGFSVANLRLKFSGKFSGGFGYRFQMNFINSPSVLDAVLYYTVSDQFKISAGQFKAPFSGEYLISAADIDFVNRSQIASSLVPKRQIGMQASGLLSNGLIEYRAGVFNGNGIRSNVNDNSNYLYVGRVIVKPKLFENPNDAIEIALNAGISNDSSSVFHGERKYFGGDFRISFGKFLLSGEFITNRFSSAGAVASDANGFQTTAGYKIFTNLQLLARYDSYSPPVVAASEYIILGLNFIPTGSTGIQINYLIDKDRTAFEYNQLLINAQIVF